MFFISIDELIDEFLQAHYQSESFIGFILLFRALK
jgi:hypothetical protein